MKGFSGREVKDGGPHYYPEVALPEKIVKILCEGYAYSHANAVSLVKKHMPYLRKSYAAHGRSIEGQVAYDLTTFRGQPNHKR
jgi:hypothetical protein